MKFTKAVLSMLSLLAALHVNADQVPVSGQKITDIRVAPWGSDSFAIRTVITGTGECDNNWIVFQKNTFISSFGQENGQKAYDRAYSMALAAMSAERPVFVVIAVDNDCSSAKTIGFIN